MIAFQSLSQEAQYSLAAAAFFAFICLGSLVNYIAQNKYSSAVTRISFVALLALCAVVPGIGFIILALVVMWIYFAESYNFSHREEIVEGWSYQAMLLKACAKSLLGVKAR